MSCFCRNCTNKSLKLPDHHTAEKNRHLTGDDTSYNCDFSTIYVKQLYALTLASRSCPRSRRLSWPSPRPPSPSSASFPVLLQRTCSGRSASHRSGPIPRPPSLQVGSSQFWIGSSYSSSTGKRSNTGSFEEDGISREDDSLGAALIDRESEGKLEGKTYLGLLQMRAGGDGTHPYVIEHSRCFDEEASGISWLVRSRREVHVKAWAASWHWSTRFARRLLPVLLRRPLGSIWFDKVV